MAHHVIEKTEHGPVLRGMFETHDEAQAFCDDLIAEDYRYKDVLTILDEPARPPSEA